MRPVTKIVVVGAGYAAAVLIAWVVVAIYAAMGNAALRNTYGGMSAFGDSLLFLGVFALAAIPATIAMLVWVRPYRWFWTMAALGAFAIAAIAAAGLTMFWRGPSASPTSLERWLTLAGVSVLIAPVFALAFGIAGLFAPTRRSRIALFAAMAAEVSVFGVLVLRWAIVS